MEGQPKPEVENKVAAYLRDIAERFINAGEKPRYISEGLPENDSAVKEMNTILTRGGRELLVLLSEKMNKKIEHDPDMNSDSIFLGRNFNSKKELYLGCSASGSLEFFTQDF